MLHLLLHDLAEDLASFTLSGSASGEALLLLSTEGVGVVGGDAVVGALLDEGGDGRDHHRLLWVLHLCFLVFNFNYSRK